MTDKIILRVADRLVIDTFDALTVESDLFVADSAFRFEMPGAYADIRGGVPCGVTVNERTIITGVIDRVTRAYSRDGGTVMRVEGRNQIGALLDAYPETFTPSSGATTIKAVAEALIARIPAARRYSVEYGPRVAELDVSAQAAQASPGMTAFEFLRGLALYRGVMLYARPGGAYYFGVPGTTAGPVFSISVTRQKNASRVISAEGVHDHSALYRTLLVVGQRSGDSLDGDIAVTGRADDPRGPEGKTMVITANDDGVTPDECARLALARQNARARSVSYTLSGYTQNGVPWAIDAPCTVRDDLLGIHETMLVQRVVFSLSRSGGSTTQVTLCEKGAVGA